jgi:uncharacterized membrane protein
VRSRVLFWFLTVLCIAIALVSYRFVALGLENAFEGMIGHITERYFAFLLHVSAAPIALALGMFQFLPRLRERRPALDRWSGRVYGVAVFVGGLAGLVLSLGSIDRPVAASGFGILAVLWLGITVQAVRLAMAGRITEHRRWMIRSFALTFAAVTLRLELPFFFILGGMEYPEASNYVAWLCWVSNILIAEWFIRRNPECGMARALPYAGD